MKRLKQIILFLLVVITIYSTMLFYLLMSVHADSRLQQIDFLEKTKPEPYSKVLYIDRLVPISDRLKYFSISRVSHKLPKSANCRQQARQGLLLIAVSSFDPIALYTKLLRELELASHEGCIPQLFVLKRLRPLVLNNQQNINKYANQLGEVIKYFTIQVEIEISIFTHEQGALLTLAYLARKTLGLLYNNIIDKIKSVIFVDITHPFLRVQYDPPYKLLHKLKLQILAEQERLKNFNKIKFIIVTTHKEDTLSQHFFYQVEGQAITFSRTVLISSREMANVHYFLPPNSLSFPPLVRRLAHLLAKDFVENLSVEQISVILRFGESYADQKISIAAIQACEKMDMAQVQFAQLSFQCTQISPLNLADEEVLLLYSSQHFSVYSDTHQKIYPFDNLTQGSIYVFQKMSNPLFIINEESTYVMISKQKIGSPRNPLKMKEEELLEISQLLFTNYSILRICPDILLTFPLHFAQGNIHRRFLGQGEENCFTQSSIFESFSWQLFLNWSLFRNMVIFTLICSQFRKQAVSQRLIQQFVMNILLLLGRQQIESQITCGIYVVSFSILVEYVNRVVLYLVSFFALKQSWASAALLTISAMCIFSSLFNLFNYWKIFTVAIFFFLNTQNLTIFMLKLYFIKEELPFYNGSYHGLADLGLITMWLYTSLPSNQAATHSDSFWSAEQIFTGLLALCLGMNMEAAGSTIETMITIYMKIIIVLRMLKIVRK